mgnify:FL=1
MTELKVFLVAKASETAINYIKSMSQELRDLGLEEAKSPEDSDLIVVAGGDGTLLKYVKYGIPVLGIKFGRRSKLLEVEPEDGKAALRKIMAGDYIVDEYPLLEADVKGSSVLVFNEIALVFDGAETVYGSVTFEDNEVEFEGDGVLIATPQGSWAWSFSASNVVLHKSVNGVVVTFLNAMKPMGLKSIVTPYTEIQVRLEDKGRDQKTKLLVDGEILGYLSKTGEGFRVRKSGRTAKIVRFGKRLDLAKVWR